MDCAIEKVEKVQTIREISESVHEDSQLTHEEVTQGSEKTLKWSSKKDRQIWSN